MTHTLRERKKRDHPAMPNVRYSMSRPRAIRAALHVLGSARYPTEEVSRRA